MSDAKSFAGEDFAAASYANASTGTIAWNGNWVETDVAGAAQSASAGNVVITGGELSLTKATSAVQRAVNLSAQSTDSLNRHSFDYRTDTGVPPVTVGSFVTGDTLTWTNQAGITTSYNSATGVLTATGAASRGTYESLLRSVQYSSSSDDPTVNNTNTARTISVVVTDSSANASNTARSTIGVQAVNDAPVLTAGATLAYTEQAAAAVIDNTITLADADDTQMASATVTIGNFVAGDTLTWTNAGTVTGVYNAGTGVLTLSGTDTLANYQAVMRSVKFSSSSDDPTANNTQTTRTVTWAATDANSDAVGAKTSAGVTSTINVTAVNDASTLATGSTLNYTENGAAAAINAALTVADLDNPTLPWGTVSITGGFASAEDALSFTNVPATMGNIAGAYNAATGVMTLTSAGGTATLAQWQAALRAVQYSNSSDNPSTAARTVSFTVNDGAANSNTVASTVNVTAVNDAAVLSSATVALAETNAPLTTGGTLTITDVDSPQTFVPQTNVAGTNGTFSIAANGAWTYTANSAFDSLNVGQLVSDTFTVASADGTTTTVQVTINGTNDAAVLSSATVALSETNAARSTGGTLTVSDVADAQTFVPQTNVAGTNGTFSIAANGTWTYTANSAFDNLNVGQSVSDTFTVASADGTTTTVQVTINGTNDAAVLSSATVALSETNAPLSTGGTLTVSDVDSAQTFVA